MADLFKILLAEKLGHCDSLYESVIGKKLGGYSWQSDYETTPYLYRAMPNLSHYYNREIMEEVVGGSVGWNQLVNPSVITNGTQNGIAFTNNGDGSISFSGTAAARTYKVCGTYATITGHKYFIGGAPANGSLQSYVLNIDAESGSVDAGSGAVFASTRTESKMYFVVANGFTANNLKFVPQLTDLTLALGSTIADYVYSLEQATAGSGVAWLKENFPRMCQYNPYDAGSIQSVSGLVSHDMTGFNQWDEEWEVGNINASTGENEANNSIIRSKGYIKAFPSTEYYVSAPESAVVLFYDADKGFIDSTTRANQTFTTPKNTAYIRFRMSYAYGNVYNHDICINLSDASRNGQYEPYRKSSYPLDSTLTLRGIPKLDNGKLYYDGDVYESDGTVTRKYGVVDLGTLNWRSAGTYFYAANIPYKTESSPSIVANMLCTKYQTVAQSLWTNYSTCIAQIQTSAEAKQILIKDGNYSTADALKTALDGVYLVYELATPTTETAQPFTKTQLCDSGGTEEFVTSGIVSVGHKSKYAEK